eukprot:10370164-Alexandrium_andersonii.AAC.1
MCIRDSLFLASRSKNIAVKGANGTWETLRKWLVRDLNQLYHNKFSKTDPWGEPLPEELAGGAGNPTLPNGLR